MLDIEWTGTSYSDDPQVAKALDDAKERHRQGMDPAEIDRLFYEEAFDGWHRKPDNYSLTID